ncbi:acetyl-CoA hydrolase/transferase family protein [Guggenheimella bovis]
MPWRKEYQNKVVDAKEAVSHIKSGNRVVIGHACGEPTVLVDAMVQNAEQYKGVEIVHMVAMGGAVYCGEEYKENFWHNAIFVGGSTRDAIKRGQGDFTPVFFYEVPKLFKSKLPIDVALVQVTPPDDHGFVNLGVSVDYTLEAVRQAKVVIAQVNRNMPRVFGDGFIHISDIDYFVEADQDIIELGRPKIGEIESQIARHCATLIHDGDTLQLGIGAIPDAVLSVLTDKKDLGIHSEMFSDGVLELYNKGVITNKKKTTYPGKMVATFLMGTKNLYDFVDNNPEVLMMPVDVVNHPLVVSQEKNIVSLNSCVQVDLMGQIASESIGNTQISGVGGQVDFVRGAAMSENGRSIIAMASTVKGKSSKIVTRLDDGAAVTTSRNDVDYVVTEYGVAELKGKSLRERSRALISIAHPDFREELIKYHCEKFNETWD